MKSKLLAVLLAPVLLASCASGYRSRPYTGPVAASQVAYRIDEYRYFEVVPLQDLACARARLYYTDTRQGIHVDVASWSRVSAGKLIIDAANVNFLVAPVILSGSSCQTGSGTSDLCAPRLHYSQDGGRNWKNIVSLTYGEVHLVGAIVYVGTLSVDTVDLSRSNIELRDWERHSNEAYTIPLPQKAPLDAYLRCKPSASEGNNE